METTQVQQLKLNVTNISSFLKQSNKKYIGLKKQNSTLFANQVQRSKIRAKEKKIEFKNLPKFGLGKVGNKIAATAGSIFDKILGFGSLILAGILVNALPKIIKTVKTVIDSIVEFVTPIQSAFNLVKGFMTGEFDKNKYDADKKRVDDKLEELNKSGGLIDQIAEQTGILEPLVKSLKPAIEAVRNVVGGKKMVLAVKGGKEGVLDKGTGEFTERQFTTSERQRYTQSKEPADNQVNQGAGKDGTFGAGTYGSGRPSGGGGGSATYGTKEQKAMLSAISFAEGTGSYGTIYGGKVVPELAQGKLTIGQVLEMQRTGRLNGRNVGYARDGYNSDATGKYQFMSYVLKEEMQKQGFSPDTLFTPALQDQMILGRISSLRGVTAGMLAREGMSANVIDRLAPEFASFPNLMGDVRHGYGTSYYGQGGKSETAIRSAYNRALGSIISPTKITPNTKNKDKQVSSLNTTMGEEGSTTFILARQPILT